METLFHFMMQEGVNHGTSPSLNTHNNPPGGLFFLDLKIIKKFFSTLSGFYIFIKIIRYINLIFQKLGLLL